jgi:hypothetical protein
MIAVYGFEACVSRYRVRGSKGEGARSAMLWMLREDDVARGKKGTR